MSIAIRVIPQQRTLPGRLAVEAGLTLAGAVMVAMLAGLINAFLRIDAYHLHVGLALLAAATGAAAVGLGITASRITGNRRASWMVPALALYSVDVVADTALLPSSPVEAVEPGLDLVIDCLLITVLLVAAIRPPASRGAGPAWLAIGLWVFLVPWQGTLADHVGWFTAHLVVLSTLSYAVLVVWLAAAAAAVVAGYRRGEAPLWRLGLGFSVIAVAHLYRQVRPWPTTEPSLVFAAVRLLGVVVILLGMAQLLRRSLSRMLDERFVHQEELRIAALRADGHERRAAEREHELRNGLIGLTGIARLLDAPGGRADDHRARRAAVAELERLTDMVHGRESDPADRIYCAREVVEELSALWRMGGMDVQATVLGDLMAIGRRSVLAQTLSNLLSNCARHAPGAAVRIVGRGDGGRIAMQVRDEPRDGPVGTLSASGQGIGLDLSRRLLQQEGGDLHVLPPDPRRPGFTVIVHLKAAPAAAGLDAVITTAARAPRRAAS